MALPYTRDWKRRQLGTSSYLKYRTEVVLVETDDVNLKTKVRVRIYGQRGDGWQDAQGVWHYPSYASTSGVKMHVRYYTSKVSTQADLIADRTVSRNDYASYTLLGTAPNAMEWTGWLDHNADGTLTLYLRVGFTYSGDNDYAPLPGDGDWETIVIPAIQTGSAYSLLDDVDAAFPGSEQSKISFAWERAVSATKHIVTIRNAVGDEVWSVTLTDGTADHTDWNLNDMSHLLLLKKMSAPKETWTVALQTYNGTTLTGTDTKSFPVTGCSLDRNVGGTWKQGILSKNVSGTWKPGILWRNCGGVWKRCKPI